MLRKGFVKNTILVVCTLAAVTFQPASAVPVSNARISQEGNFVVWDANGQPTGQTTILGQSITSIGTATPPTTVRGPIPAASDPGIDSRYIV